MVNISYKVQAVNNLTKYSTKLLICVLKIQITPLFQTFSIVTPQDPRYLHIQKISPHHQNCQIKLIHLKSQI